MQSAELVFCPHIPAAPLNITVPTVSYQQTGTGFQLALNVSWAVRPDACNASVSYLLMVTRATGEPIGNTTLGPGSCAVVDGQVAASAVLDLGNTSLDLGAYYVLVLSAVTAAGSSDQVGPFAVHWL